MERERVTAVSFYASEQTVPIKFCVNAWFRIDFQFITIHKSSYLVVIKLDS
jgi:hypothetical protein